MKKWADYLISEVSYDKNHLISMAKRHEDTKDGICNENMVDRLKISSDIANGLSYITIYNRISTWKKGNKIRFFRIDGEPYLRIDENKVNQDYLGDIPENESYSIQEPEEATPEQIDHVKQLEKQIAELESPSSQKTVEPPKSTRGSLPKETNEEPPQELELVPEPITEPEEATPEQIARLEKLEKQIAELESQSVKEPEPEEATPEQIARVKQLEKQIKKLESKPKKKKTKSEKATPEQIARVKQLEKQIAELESQSVKEPEPEEATPEQIARVKQLEKQIKKLESKPKKKKTKSEKATPEQIARLEKLEKQIAELEAKQKLDV